jgi:hypothetical protein
MAAKQVGGIRKTIERGRTQYIRQLWCEQSDLSSSEPAIGSVATWAPTSARVVSVQRTPVGPDVAYLIDITAESMVSTYNPYEDLEDKIIRKRLSGEMYFKKSWFGMREATSIDVENEVLNPSEEICSVGELVYINANNQDKGTPDYTLSPFTDASTLNIKLVEKKVKTEVFEVEFFTKKDITNIPDFIGVNGSFGSGMSPGSTTSGTWRADYQEMEEVRDRDGKTLTRIVRRMTKAPDGMYWDKQKNRQDGVDSYWTWA